MGLRYPVPEPIMLRHRARRERGLIVSTSSPFWREANEAHFGFRPGWPLEPFEKD